jgi:hypothetical protein
MALDRDEFSNKGAVEQDTPTERGNESMTGQLGHRDQNALIKNSDSDYPEPGNNEEHSGEPREGNTKEEDPEHKSVDQDPGHRQKGNQNDEKDDPLAA